MATEAQKRELVTKVARLVRTRFQGNYKTAFDHYAGKAEPAGLVDRDELVSLLKDADIGNAFTRGAWASGIIEELDTSKDGKIGWSEFQKQLERGG